MTASVWEPIQDLTPCAECGGERRLVRLSGLGAQFERIDECKCRKDAIASKLAADEERERAEARRYATQQALEISEIGSHFAERTFATYDEEPENEAAFLAATRCTDRIRQAHHAKALAGVRGIGLTGPVGVGKTHLAGAIANDCIVHGIPAVIATTADLLAKLRASYDRRSAISEAEFRYRLKMVPLLVLDDLGREPRTQPTLRALLDLVNMRTENRLPVIVTSNFTPRELGEMYEPLGDDGITMLDRLREVVQWPWIRMQGVSKRGRV